MTDFDMEPDMAELKAQEGLAERLSPIVRELLSQTAAFPTTAALAATYLRKGEQTYDQAGALSRSTYNKGETYHVALVVEVSKYADPDLFAQLAQVDDDLAEQKLEAKRRALSGEVDELQRQLNRKLDELNAC